jgi:hypothetical protein
VSAGRIEFSVASLRKDKAEFAGTERVQDLEDFDT